MTESSQAQGRTMGQLSKEERREVLRRVLGAMKDELESPEVAAILSRKEN
jgi:hypothetical protein